MCKFLTATAAVLALGGMTLGAAAPAEARSHGRWHGGYHGGYHGHYRHHGGGSALAAGIIGLGVGAAIASDRGYYGPAYYGPAYYAPPPPPPAYYYGGPYCRSDWRWDGYARRYVRVQYCD